MGIKKSQILLAGKYQSAEVSYSGAAGTVTLLGAPPAGKIRRVLAGDSGYTGIFNRDNVSHALGWVAGGVPAGLVFSTNTNRFFSLPSGIVLHAGESLQFSVGEGNSTLPLQAVATYIEADAATATFGGAVVALGDATQTTIVPAPPAGKFRLVYNEGNFGLASIFNMDAAPHTVTFRVGSTIVEVQDIDPTQGQDPQKMPALRPGQTYSAQLEGVPALPVLILMTWDDYDLV